MKVQAYRLTEDHVPYPVQIDLEELPELLFKDDSKWRVLQQDSYGPFWVSTVFMADRPYWETRVFDSRDDSSESVDSYKYADAERQHSKIFKDIEERITNEGINEDDF